MYLVWGLLGFFLCGLFDLNKIRWHRRVFNLLFPLGSLLILLGTADCVLSGASGIRWTPGSFVLLAGAAASLGTLIYALFFALPAGDTYGGARELTVVAEGLYALCRHPGFWPFGACYGFLAALVGTREMGLCALCYTGANLIYILLQDRYIFPRYIGGYGRYRREVPFLVPTAASIRKAFSRKQS